MGASVQIAELRAVDIFEVTPIPTTTAPSSTRSIIYDEENSIRRISIPAHLSATVTMADQVQELLEIPSEFTKDGIQFIKRCTKRTLAASLDTRCAY